MPKKRNNAGKGIIYSRYILPLLSDLILITSMFIPCINYILDSEVKDKMSISMLIHNSWENSRYYLFSSQSNPTPEGTVFYKAVFITIIIAAILFLLAIAVDIFGLTTIINEANSEEPGKLRILYSTLIPNRFVLCILRLPIFPILLFPNIIELLYRNILFYPVSVNYNLLYPWILALLLFVLQIIFIVISKKFERRLSLDILSKNIISDNINADIQEEDYISESKIYTIHTSASSDVNANIRQIFADNESDKK